MNRLYVESVTRKRWIELRNCLGSMGILLGSNMVFFPLPIQIYVTLVCTTPQQCLCC